MHRSRRASSPSSWTRKGLLLVGVLALPGLVSGCTVPRGGAARGTTPPAGPPGNGLGTGGAGAPAQGLEGRLLSSLVPGAGTATPPRTASPSILGITGGSSDGAAAPPATASIPPVPAGPAADGPVQPADRQTAPDLGSLPPLANDASPADLKEWVSRVYDQFPQFAQVFEEKVGLSRDQALAFMYADMSRESGDAGRWKIDLETGQGGPGHAWGPFQAAVTNFRGGGYDGSIDNALGLPTPEMSQFKNAPVSTFAGMKRLVEGLDKALEEIGPGHPPEDYLLGTLADHNTGWVRSWSDPDWRKAYGDEVLRLMQGYLAGHMTDDKAYWTGEAL